jgi:hypothetical protein
VLSLKQKREFGSTDWYQRHEINRLKMVWLILKFVDFFWYYIVGAVGLPILLAK